MWISDYFVCDSKHDCLIPILQNFSKYEMMWDTSKEVMVKNEFCNLLVI